MYHIVPHGVETIQVAHHFPIELIEKEYEFLLAVGVIKLQALF